MSRPGLEHTRWHGLLIQQFQSTTDPIEQLSIMRKYMRDHAEDVQSFLHHVTQGSVYHASSELRPVHGTNAG